MIYLYGHIYALSQSSLDQVFVQFAKEQTQPENEIL
jgi:hypothetical protein